MIHLPLTNEIYHFFNSQHSEAKFRNVKFVLQYKIPEEQRKIYYVIKLIIKCSVINDFHVNFPNIKSLKCKEYSKITDKSLENFGETLEKLDCSDTEITGSCFVKLKKLRRIFFVLILIMSFMKI